jgi:hypothetical protein
MFLIFKVKEWFTANFSISKNFKGFKSLQKIVGETFIKHVISFETIIYTPNMFCFFIFLDL